MKNRSVFSLFTLILVIFGMFTVCTQDPTQPFIPLPGSNYTVNFEANGGIPAPGPQTIAAGGTVVQPPAMTKTGYNFGGWYKEEECINQWDFAADTVNGNITLYARWNSDGSTYTVNFEANGGIPAPGPQTIADGGTVVMPPAMTNTGYIFGGWYKDTACTNQWNFAADTVTGDITLYAQWIPATVVSGTTLADKLQWLINNAERNSAYLLEVTAVYEALAPQNISYPGRNDITIQLQGIGSGRVIGLSGNGSLFSIGNGVTLILDKDLVLSGKDSNDASLIRVNSGGTLIMNQGVKISGNSGFSSYGGGVFVGGTFTMSGGEISGNATYNYGGGVYVAGGTFTMSGGEISGNSSSFLAGGGGVYVAGGTFTMSGGEISGNNGSGVYVAGTFTMSGGEISGNNGSGVYVDGTSVMSGTFTMSGGEISGNTAGSYGGGVYVASNRTFTMSGGEILGNTASYAGGGVYVASNGTFTKLGGGTITGYASDTVNGNVVKNSSGVVQSNQGHAVYVTIPKRLENTATPEVNLDSRIAGVAGGWTGWDYVNAATLTADTWADGNLSSSGDVQWFKFTATASTQYIHVSFGTLSYADVQVYDSDGTVRGCQYLYDDSYIVTVTNGQVYYIGVSSDNSGTYRIAFNSTVVPPGTTVTTLTTDTWADGNLSSSGDVQWFKFTATASTQYIHVSFSTLTYLYVQLYDSSGATVGSRDFSVSDYITQTVTNGQVYYIRVSSDNSGTYRIAFNTTSTTPPS